MHFGQDVLGKWRAAPDFGDAIRSPALEVSKENSRWWVLRRTAWLDAALFFCFILFVLCAPIATKGAVTAFRAALLLWLILFIALFFPISPDVRAAMRASPTARAIDSLDTPAYAMLEGALPKTVRIVAASILKHHRL